MIRVGRDSSKLPSVHRHFGDSPIRRLDVLGQHLVKYRFYECYVDTGIC